MSTGPNTSLNMGAPLNGQPRVLTALDIGTSKVTAMIARINDNNKLQVIGVGTQPSHGMKKGVVVNIEATITAIQKAVTDAQNMASVPVKSVVVGISGAHVHSFNSTGVVAISNHEVSERDIDRVIEAAQAVAIPADQRILHILPQEFIIDKQEGIKDPLGMSGVRLEAKVHMVTGSVSAAQNNIKCIRHCGLEVSDLVLAPLASSYAVLTEDEKELGVCMIDIGAGTTDISVFIDGAIVHTAVLPIGGSQVSNDLAHALRSSLHFAESIKLNYGAALASQVHPEDSIEVPGMADRPGKVYTLQALAEVIQSRYEELFSLIKQDLERVGFKDSLAAGIVLTGGASKPEGLVQLAELVFAMPVRLGLPDHEDLMGLKEVIMDPAYSSVAGLLLYTQQQMADEQRIDLESLVGVGSENYSLAGHAGVNSKSHGASHRQGHLGALKLVKLNKVKSWFSKYF